MSTQPLPPIPLKLREIGILVVIVIQGRNLASKSHPSKQDPYVVCSLSNSTSTSTKVNEAGGQDPTWDEELRFTVWSPVPNQPQKLKLSVHAKESEEDNFLGEGDVEIDGKWPKNEFDDWVLITLNGKPQGEIFLEMTFYPVEPQPVKVAPHLPPKSQFLPSNLTRRASRYTPAERLARPTISHYTSSTYSNPNQVIRPPLPAHPHSINDGRPSYLSTHQQQQHYPAPSRIPVLPVGHLPFPGEPEVPARLRPGRQPSEEESNLRQQQQPYNPQGIASLSIDSTRYLPTSSPPLSLSQDPNHRPYSPTNSIHSIPSPSPPPNRYLPPSTPSLYPAYQPQQAQPYQYQYSPQPSFVAAPAVLQPSYSPPLPHVVNSNVSNLSQTQQQHYVPYPHQQYQNPQFQSQPQPQPHLLPQPPEQYQSVPSIPPRPSSSPSLISQIPAHSTTDNCQSQSQSPPPRPPKAPIIPPKIALSKTSSPSPYSSSQPARISSLPSPSPISLLPAASLSTSTPSPSRPLPSLSSSSSPTTSRIHSGQASLALRIQQEHQDALLAAQLASDDEASIAKALEEARLKRLERERLDAVYVERLNEEEKRRREEEEERDREYAVGVEKEREEEEDRRRRKEVEDEKANREFVERLSREEEREREERRKREEDDERLARELAAG